MSNLWHWRIPSANQQGGDKGSEMLSTHDGVSMGPESNSCSPRRNQHMMRDAQPFNRGLRIAKLNVEQNPQIRYARRFVFLNLGFESRDLVVHGGHVGVQVSFELTSFVFGYAFEFIKLDQERFWLFSRLSFPVL